jgi:hypothetical protein
MQKTPCPLFEMVMKQTMSNAKHFYIERVPYLNNVESTSAEDDEPLASVFISIHVDEKP